MYHRYWPTSFSGCCPRCLFASVVIGPILLTAGHRLAFLYKCQFWVRYITRKRPESFHAGLSLTTCSFKMFNTGFGKMYYGPFKRFKIWSLARQCPRFLEMLACPQKGVNVPLICSDARGLLSCYSCRDMYHIIRKDPVGLCRLERAC